MRAVGQMIFKNSAEKPFGPGDFPDCKEKIAAIITSLAIEASSILLWVSDSSLNL